MKIITEFNKTNNRAKLVLVIRLKTRGNNTQIKNRRFLIKVPTHESEISIQVAVLLDLLLVKQRSNAYCIKTSHETIDKCSNTSVTATRK